MQFADSTPAGKVFLCDRFASTQSATFNTTNVIPINPDDPLETVKKFAETTGITYPIGLDPKADIFALYAVREAGNYTNVI